MAKKYWEKFYKTFKEDSPSSFAKFVGGFINSHGGIKTMTELGAGNGRDTKYLKEIIKVKAYDYAFGSKDVKKMSLKDVIKNEKPCDIVYSRFFLHCLTKKEIRAILDWTPKYFFAEFRTTDDVPKLYKDHKRHLVDVCWFLRELRRRGFGDIWFDHRKGLSPYKNEDPVVCWILTKRKK